MRARDLERCEGASCQQRIVDRPLAIIPQQHEKMIEAPGQLEGFVTEVI